MLCETSTEMKEYDGPQTIEIVFQQPVSCMMELQLHETSAVIHFMKNSKVYAWVASKKLYVLEANYMHFVGF